MQQCTNFIFNTFKNVMVVKQPIQPFGGGKGNTYSQNRGHKMPYLRIKSPGNLNLNLPISLFFFKLRCKMKVNVRIFFLGHLECKSGFG